MKGLDGLSSLVGNLIERIAMTDLVAFRNAGRMIHRRRRHRNRCSLDQI